MALDAFRLVVNAFRWYDSFCGLLEPERATWNSPKPSRGILSLLNSKSVNGSGDAAAPVLQIKL